MALWIHIFRKVNVIINVCLNYTILLSLIFHVNDKKHWSKLMVPQKNQTKNYPVLCLVIRSCPTLCNPMVCSPRGSSVHGDSPGKNSRVGCHALLQGVFPTQGSNPGLLHCRWILYHLSHQGSPRILEWVACPFASRSSWPRNWTRVSLIEGGFFTSWATREATQGPFEAASSSICFPSDLSHILFYLYKSLCIIIYHTSVMVLTFSKTVIVL